MHKNGFSVNHPVGAMCPSIAELRDKRETQATVLGVQTQCTIRYTSFVSRTVHRYWPLWGWAEKSGPDRSG